MVFACQNGSFLKTFTTNIKSCNPASIDNENCFEVICEDTILFPEGGGQPWDTGFMNEVAVFKVLRKGPDALHYLKTPLEVGTEVKQTIDWERRLDHMQQHSGQHLITAVINLEYQIETTSWWLGKDVCHIELNTKTLDNKQIENIEKIANRKIWEQTPVEVIIYNPDDPNLDKSHTKDLPSDVSGPLRLVRIVGMEDNMCCGTHVSNLSQLTSVKLLGAVKGKKNKINLLFLAGGRVLNYLTKALEREAKLKKLLNSEPDQYPDLVKKLQINLKETKNTLSKYLKMEAERRADQLLAMSPRPLYYFDDCPDGDQEYIDTFIRRIKDDPDILETVTVLVVGETCGMVVLYGKPETISEYGPRYAETLGGKGFAHGNKFQAKVNDVKQHVAAREVFPNQKPL